MSNAQDEPRVDYGLRLYHEVFKLEALHFGLWEPGEPLTLEALRGAQRRYTDRLLDMFPDGITRVLDAGCGSGATSAILAERGLAVEALTPDAYQIKVFRQRRGDAIPVHQARLQDFRPTSPYDLLLMSESAQYIPCAELFEAARRVLKPGGWLVMSDYFRLQDSAYYKTCHVHAQFLDRARDAGFTIEAEEDVTERALPTLQLGREVYRGYVLPILEISAGFLQQKAPLLTRGVQVVLRGKLRKLRWYLYDKSEEKLDHERFARELRYMFYRFRLEP